MPPPPPGGPVPSGAGFDAGAAAASAGAAMRGVSDGLGIGARLCAWILDFIRALLPQKILDVILGISLVVGQWALLVAALFMCAFFIYAAFEGDSAEPLLYVLATVIGYLIADFVATRFVHTARKVLNASESFLSDTSVLDVISLLIIIATIWLSYELIKVHERADLGIAVVADIIQGIGLLLVAAIPLHAALLRIRTGQPKRASEEGAGLLAAIFKVPLAGAPIIFAAFMLSGAIAVIGGLIEVMGDGPSRLAELYITGGMKAIFYGVLFPPLAYLFFVIYMLIIDLIQAVVRACEVKMEDPARERVLAAEFASASELSSDSLELVGESAGVAAGEAVASVLIMVASEEEQQELEEETLAAQESHESESESESDDVDDDADEEDDKEASDDS